VPKYIPREWCGVSYQAYVDFISQRNDLAVYTVDTDYGCGVIRKLANPSAGSAAGAGAELLGDWRSKRDDPMAAFAFSCEDQPSLAFTSALALAKSIWPA
jgi:hypothetical protein